VVEPSGFEPHVHCGHQTGPGASADYVDMLVGIAKHVDLRLLHLSVPGVNYFERRIDSSELLPVLTRCLT